MDRVCAIFLLLLLFIPCVFAEDYKNSTIRGLIEEYYANGAEELSDPCGNGIIDEGENCGNCKDAVCRVGEECRDNDCIKSKFSFLPIAGLIMLAMLLLAAFVLWHRSIINWALIRSGSDKLIIVLVFAFFVVFLLLAYSRTNTISFSLSSTHVDEFASVIINKDVAEELFKLHAANEPTEFSVCLKGKYAKGRYEVDSLAKTEILDVSRYYVKYSPCPRWRHIGSIHTHYDPEPCNLSSGDIYAFGQKEDVISGLVCGNDTIRIFNRQFLTIPVHSVIR